MLDSTMGRSPWLAFLRHGSAEAGGYPLPDSDRRLTERGRKEVEETAAKARRAQYLPIAAYTSPYPRARETAEIFLEGLHSTVTLREDARIVPEAGVATALAWIRGLVEGDLSDMAAARSPGGRGRARPPLSGASGSFPIHLFVAHEPILSSLASLLLGRRRPPFERAELVVLSQDGSSWQERTHTPVR